MASCKICGKRETALYCVCARCMDKPRPQWIHIKDGLPPEDQLVLVVVSGRPHKNITLENAACLAEYASDGWILEMWPEWTEAEVSHWLPLPELPKEEQP